MQPFLKLIVGRQLEASIRMFEESVQHCPDSLWTKSL